MDNIGLRMSCISLVMEFHRAQGTTDLDINDIMADAEKLYEYININNKLREDG